MTASDHLILADGTLFATSAINQVHQASRFNIKQAMFCPTRQPSSTTHFFEH